jgi:hypothetical protein
LRKSSFACRSCGYIFLKHYYALVEQTNITQNHYYLVTCDEDGRDLVLNGINTKFFVRMMKGFKNSKNQSQNWIGTSIQFFFKKELK